VVWGWGDVGSKLVGSDRAEDILDHLSDSLKKSLTRRWWFKGRGKMSGLFWYCCKTCIIDSPRDSLHP